ncbi:hypothetical protein PAXRUDRAFT_16674 [Paxillus rubicundulus Ve08.2h10]|uniref:Uncharacterized protein n=1 Tax=Paxillus rubicundulus Ve08.2h10 TaxID=930991 RepID=A0A0D0CTQ2_9AGAM|nr:hypothetical protein PAXRUDRAFT_16674 [Paxillus rubicundulus Ve08.2h10]
MTDSVAAHPWSQFHLGTNAETSPTEVIERPGPSTVGVPKMVPSAVKVEEGKFKMSDVMPTEEGKEKEKVLGAGKEMGGDSRAVTREGKAKGKGKEKEVGEEMEVEKSKGKGKGKGKEVLEATAEKGMLKNKRKGRESNKDIRQARGCSQSMSQAPLPLKKSQLSKMYQTAGPSRPPHKKFNSMVIPLPSHSFAWSSMPPAHQSMQPKASPSTLPVFEDKEIANLQAQV